MDGRGQITSWNPRAETLFGWSSADVVGRSLADTIIPAAMREPHRRGLARYLATGEGAVLNRRIEVMALRRDGSEFPVELAITPLKASSDDISFSAFLSDITVRKRAEEQLQRTHDELELRVADRTAELARANHDLAEQSRKANEASRFKSEFLANMSHELRTPLNAIIGFTKLMRAGKAGAVSADQIEFLHDILTSSQHLLQLVNDILDLARVEAGKIEFRPEVVDLNKVISEVRAIVRELAATRRIHIDVTIDSDVGSVVLDPGRLKQVLYNLLSNAIKFTNEDGRVSIRARAEGTEHFRLEVEDTGIGIKAEDVRRLFIEFQQLDATASKRYQGTGLGLALTRQLVEAQGGTVGVTSTPGRGSVFYAVLPRVGGAVTSDTQLPAVRHRPHGPVVLVVEDDVIDREWLVRTLSDAGIAADTAATGKEAITLAKTRQYDAITVDLLLPDIQGQTVIQAIREEGPNRETPVIVVTVLAERGLGLGFRIHDVLSKPVRADELVAALNRVGVPRDGSQPILIVDDDPQALKLAHTVLQDFGYRSICRSDSESGLRAALEERPAAIVLDLLMPGMNGFEFLQRFRSSPGSRGVPIIIWSVADLTTAERERVMELAQGVVPKGQGGQVLIDELRAFLSPPAQVAQGAHSRESLIRGNQV
jgi:PAS domain S-box-containing protein